MTTSIGLLIQINVIKLIGIEYIIKIPVITVIISVISLIIILLSLNYHIEKSNSKSLLLLLLGTYFGFAMIFSSLILMVAKAAGIIKI
jgi:hypothetical protein